jgi:glycosyltransferase involved in cell wall biosynthesis
MDGEKRIAAILPTSMKYLSGMGHGIYWALKASEVQTVVVDPFSALETRLRWHCLSHLLRGREAYRAAKGRAGGSADGFSMRSQYLNRIWQQECRGIEFDAVLQVSTLCGPPSGNNAPYLVYVDHTSKMSERDNLSWHKLRGDPDHWHRLQLNVYRAAALVFVPSPNVQQSVVDDHGVNAGHVACVGFGTDHRPAAEWNAVRPIDIATVITDPERQRLRLFLESVDRLAEKDNSLDVVVIGTEASHPRVRFLGRQSRQEVRMHLGKVKVFVMPAHMGGLQSVLEAMAAGCATVITSGNAATWPLEYADPTPCIVVPPDPTSMAAAISDLLYDHELREHISRAGPRVVSEEYSWESVVRRMLFAAGLAK